MKTRLTEANLIAFIVGALALAGAIVLTALHDAVPGYVWAIALAGVTAGAGLSVPNNAATTFDSVDLLHTFANLAPQMVADLNKAAPGAVKVEDVAAEILRQVAAANTANTTPATTTTTTTTTAAPPTLAAAAPTSAPTV